MEDREQDISAVGRRKRRFSEALRRGARVFIGVDIGSTSSDVVMMDAAGQVVFSDYRRTKGRPIATVREQLGRVLEMAGCLEIAGVAVTGSAGRFFSKLMGVSFVNEVAAQGAAIGRLYSGFRQATVIDMGGQDSKLIFLSGAEGGGMEVRDFALNSVCAAGTGAFLDQQAERLGVSIEGEFGRLALASRSVPRMAGRCSVFAKTDMIHLQQQATPTCDILAGLCLALARNLKSNLGGGRRFVEPIVFTGGVAANEGVVRAMEDVFEMGRGGLVVPEYHFFTGAMGAVLVSRRRGLGDGTGFKLDVVRLDRYLAERGSGLCDAPRRQRLARPSLPAPESRVYEELLKQAAEPIDVYLGVDVGSISTNVVVMDEKRRVLSKAYLMTAGRPLEAVRQGLDMVGREVSGKVRILGAASTGSGRYLTGDFIGADVVINEITAQAAGAAIVNPDVDTIFEIGGQDSKYISLENGVVVDFEMNHACAAGTGSFLEEQSQRLDIDINEEFAELAFRSASPIRLGERCTVFMESDLLSFQQQGARREDLIAGLSYSIVANYLNRVVGRHRIGENICFQGGTAYNKAICSAFEQVTGKAIMVPDHHEVTGALGAASIAAERMALRRQAAGGPVASKFRGFELAHIEYKVESFTCEHCPNHCEVKKVELPGAEPLYYGSRCDRYNLKAGGRKKSRFGAFSYREKKLLETAGLGDGAVKPKAAKGRVGIPLALVNRQLLPLFSRFLQELGYEVVLSGRTNRRIIRLGVEVVPAQPCFPVKVAYGHVAALIDKGVDYIFLPSIVSMTREYKENEHSQLCPYVQSLGYQVRTTFAEQLGSTRVLTGPLRLGEGQRLLRKGFLSLGRQLGVSRRVVGRAIRAGFAAQEQFEEALRRKGQEILEQVGQGEKLFVLVSRPYNGCDEGINLELPKKLAELGAEVIPMEMLELGAVELSDERLHRGIYWSYGQKILRAAELIKRDDRLFAIYLSNFSCGPDSFLQTFFRDVMQGKPSLLLELDEHSADAGVITRLEAFLESLKHYERRRGQGLERQHIAGAKGVNRERTLYIPYMGDCSYGMAACFRGCGQPAEVMPIAGESVLVAGRAYMTGKECLPCVITTGNMLDVVQSEGFDARHAAFLMPGSSGPCRFGMYSCMHRLILREAGAAEVPVIAPNQDGSFYREFGETVEGASKGRLLRDMWIAIAGIDLLGKLILRIRPFARDRGAAQGVYKACLRRWLAAVEQRSGLDRLRRLMESIGADFAQVELDGGLVKPRIGVVGEIYVRNHPFANMDVIKRLEQLGAACDLSSLAEWVYYTNFTRKAESLRWHRWGRCLTNMTQNHLQHRLERLLAVPLERHFGSLAEKPIEHVLGLAQPYLDASFEGEAILSVGKMVEYYQEGFGGVVNVMPFSCMPSTVVSTQTMRVSADCGGMPILNLSFDGQEDPALTTRLEAFVEQVRQRQSGGVCAAEVVAT